MLFLLLFSGPAISLFQKSYFELMKQALRPGGIVCSQADTFWGHLKNAASMRNHCKEVFAKAAYATSYVSTYPAGQIGYALGSLDEVTKTNFFFRVHFTRYILTKIICM